MKSLKQAAEVHHFRQPNEGEDEPTYRTALANHVQPIDFVESCEIRNGKGWDKFTESDNKDMVMRAISQRG